ncbi:hypothetical protein RFI_24599 [Reticulomyxa filosa]|uniref:Glycoside hydrolase family 3 C-terminal domain-containing protein n=1 Tax=Reticulomyxa filosa TaxID=46433 RepID=X6MH68_RETFI|nr:hypothetical protein RFI_24599 [Reticulomyxa filosa]|eukprot:ETO12777.1 hypothetical protein RFI_24599 [Reticulomyxa filosa]
MPKKRKFEHLCFFFFFPFVISIFTVFSLFVYFDWLTILIGLKKKKKKRTQESEGNDRTSLALPGVQNQLISSIANVTTGPIILVLLSGGCVDVSQWQQDSRISAILWAGYPGMFGGLAIFDVIFGEVNPSAMLTQTWYLNSYVNHVLMTDMNMRPSSSNDGNPGRGYRYYPGSVNYPFGYGLSYTSFSCSVQNHTTTSITIKVNNLKSIPGSTPVLAYWAPTNAGARGLPLKRLIGFDKIFVDAQAAKDTTLNFYSEFIISGEINTSGTFTCETLK